MTNHNPMSISEELSSFYAPDTGTNALATEEEAVAAATAASHRAAEEYAASRAESDYINSHGGHLYGEGGEMHFSIQHDTVMDFGNGIKTTVGAANLMGICPPHIAQQAGLSSRLPGEGAEPTQEEQAPDIDGNHWEPQLVAQAQHAVSLVGAESFAACLKGDQSAAAALATKAGCEVEDVAELVHDTLSHLGRDVVNYAAVEGLSGRELDLFERYLVSNRVSLEGYHGALLGARQGNYADAAKLVERFKVARRIAASS